MRAVRRPKFLVLDSPFVGNVQFERLLENFNAPMVEIDCTFPTVVPGELQKALNRIRSEAEDAVRSGAGHLVLTDHHASRPRWPCR